VTGSRDYHFAVFHWLAQSVEHVSRKFQQLVEEEHTVMSEADFAGSRRGSTTNQSRVRDGVVRRSERSRGVVDCFLV
jgi:hypothetical protein